MIWHHIDARSIRGVAICECYSKGRIQILVFQPLRSCGLAGIVVTFAASYATVGLTQDISSQINSCDEYSAIIPNNDPVKKYVQNLAKDISASINEPPDFLLCEVSAFSLLVAAEPLKRRIIYDRGIFAGIAMGGDRNKAGVFLIGHEIGHVLLHHAQSQNPEDVKREELAADEFAGYAAKSLDLQRDLARQVLSALIQVEQETDRKPSRSQRISAFERGFDSGKRPPAASNLANTELAKSKTPQAIESSQTEPTPYSDGIVANGDVASEPTDTSAYADPLVLLGSFEKVMEYIAKFGAAVGVLYGGYLWLVKERRRRRRKSGADNQGRGSEPPKFGGGEEEAS